MRNDAPTVPATPPSATCSSQPSPSTCALMIDEHFQQGLTARTPIVVGNAWSDVEGRQHDAEGDDRDAQLHCSSLI